MADKQAGENIYRILHPSPSIFIQCGFFCAHCLPFYYCDGKAKAVSKKGFGSLCLQRLRIFLIVRMGTSTPINRSRIFQMRPLWFRVLQCFWCSFFRDLILLQSNKTHTLTQNMLRLMTSLMTCTKLWFTFCCESVGSAFLCPAYQS
jgi:hypothetical protein